MNDISANDRGSREGAAPAELSRPVTVADIPPEGREVEITASAEEAAALARRFDLIAVDRLTARVRLRTTMTGEIEVTGDLAGDVVQRCVVTLEPVVGSVADSFALRFSREYTEEDEVFDEDAPLLEPWPGAEIDAGEIVAQHLALALDPYPRAPGAEVPAPAAGNGADDVANGGGGGPFAVLERLRDKLPDKG